MINLHTESKMFHFLSSSQNLKVTHRLKFKYWIFRYYIFFCNTVCITLFIFKININYVQPIFVNSLISRHKKSIFTPDLHYIRSFTQHTHIYIPVISFYRIQIFLFLSDILVYTAPVRFSCNLWITLTVSFA